MGFGGKPESCAGCPALTAGRSFVRATGPSSARIALVGQGPGEDEAWAGVPFVGRSGVTLSRWLARAGIDRTACHVSNVVWCWLPKNRPPSVAEVAHCERHWQPPLQQLPDLRVVVPIGIPAIKAVLLTERANMNWAGRVVEHPTLPGVTVVPVLHPAFILRGMYAQEPAQIAYLRRAKHIADTGELPVTELPANSLLQPTFEEMLQWEHELRASGDGMAVDIETAGDHIRMIGMAHLAYPHRPIAIHFRTMGGQPYWSGWRDFTEVATWVWRLLADDSLDKVFHNGQAFDVPLLELNGFQVAGYTFDTMLAQHVCYPGMSKGLEYMSKFYLGSPGWKHMVKDEFDGEDK